MTKKINCLKCGSPIREIIEGWGSSIHFERCPETGKISLEGHIDSGSPDGKVYAQCWECGHQWRLRGVSTITDLQDKCGTFKGL